MDTRAKHLLAELHGCDPELLNDAEALERMMLAAAAHARAHVVGKVAHRYAPQGVTCVLVLAESHFSLHTWPEAGYAAADFYTCGAIAAERAFELLSAGLSATRCELLSVERGLRQGSPFRVSEAKEAARR